MKLSPARLAQSRARQAAYVARGLRTDGKPRLGRKPCGCMQGCCLKCSKPTNRLYWTDAEVAAMAADYQSGMTAAAVERKHGVANKGLRDIFIRRGLPWREYTQRHARNVSGTFVPDPPKTAAEIAALIAGLKTLKVPEALKVEWRRWPMARRGQFIARARAHLQALGHTFAPTGPCSKNVQPFDYTTPAARAIVAAANAGRNSQTKAIHMRPGSQGVIFEKELWFWAHDGYQRQMHGHVEDGRGGHRPFLHRHLYERFHGPIPAGQTVIFKDGNKNNFAPANLALRSMAACARMNAWHRHPEKFPGLVQRIAQKAWETKNVKSLARQRGLVSALLAPKNETGLLAALQRRKTDENN